MSAQEENKPKRSRSIEGLVSKSQSSESPFEISEKEPVGQDKPAVPAAEPGADQAAQKARHFWQKKHSNKAAKTSESKREEAKRDAKKRGTTQSSSKPPLPTNAKQNKLSPSKSSSSSSSQQHAESKDSHSRTSAKVQEKKNGISPSVRTVPSPSSPPGSPELHRDSKKKKHSLFGGKARSRSESPERSPTKSSKSTSSKDSFAGHPLEVATSLKSLDGESAPVAETESETPNVLDIIKRYDQKDELAKNQSKPGSEKGAAVSPSQVEKPAKGKADSSKKEGGKSKGQKEKPSKDERKKEESSSRGLLSFFKRGKAHEEETTAGGNSNSKQEKKKLKKEKESKQAAKDSKEAEKLQFTIKGRIEKLKESGVYTDGAEGAESSPVVLLAVTKREDAERTDFYPALLEDDEGHDESPAIEGETEVGETEVIAGENVEVVESKLEEPAQQVLETEESEVSDAVDRVKRLQSIFQPVCRVYVATLYQNSYCVWYRIVSLTNVILILTGTREEPWTWEVTKCQ